MASSRVEHWIAAAVVHSLCSVEERASESSRVERQELSGGGGGRGGSGGGGGGGRLQYKEHRVVGRAPSRSSAAYHDR